MTGYPATEVDVMRAQAQRWGCEAVLRDIYQQADMAGMIEVIEAQAKLRDAK